MQVLANKYRGLQRVAEGYVETRVRFPSPAPSQCLQGFYEFFGFKKPHLTTQTYNRVTIFQGSQDSQKVQKFPLRRCPKPTFEAPQNKI
jgi:hypothetical protein